MLHQAFSELILDLSGRENLVSAFSAFGVRVARFGLTRPGIVQRPTPTYTALCFVCSLRKGNTFGKYIWAVSQEVGSKNQLMSLQCFLLSPVRGGENNKCEIKNKSTKD